MKIQKLKCMENQGITLVSLIITIIVLLILAGVTISTIAGKDGILLQAENVKNKVIETETIETVKLHALCSIGNDGKVNKEELNNNLKNTEGVIYNDKALSDTNNISSLPAIIELNGHYIEIKSNGEVKKIPEALAKILQNPKEYYGQKVTNYKDDGKTYRIFYVDKENYFGDGENTIYLKADYEGSAICLTSYNEKQTKVRELNPLWAKNRGNSEKEWRENEKAAAWLCDPSKWTAYCNTQNAKYAIGGPSVEMYVKSYNEAYKGIEGANVLGTAYRDKAVHGYIYTLNGTQSTISKDDYSTGNDSLDFKKYNNMYCGKNEGKTGDWWLASPCALDFSRMCFVYGFGAKIDYRNYNSSNRSGLSPIVCLKTSFVPQIEKQK